MRYVIRTLPGFGLIAFSWVVFGYAIYVQLVSTNPRIDPPWSYGTGLDGPPPLDVGGAPPKPIG
jgi:hypothetical protein